MDELPQHSGMDTQRPRHHSDSSAPDVCVCVHVCVGVCVCVRMCERTCAARGSLLDKVSQLTVADEGAFGVLAVAVETDVWVQVTLVHIWADRHGQTQIICERCGLERSE